MPSDCRPATTRMDLAIDSSGSPPGIAALFLIRFDVRAGYTIAWKKTASDIVLENAVEFKSLPSGLHNVKEDLVYFVHERYAGLSAFVNEPAGEAERNAIMLSVGVLAPLSHGRLGRSWKHAAGLKDLALQLAADPDNTQPLTEYWDKFQLRDDEASSPPDSPLDSMSHSKTGPAPIASTKRRQRALSDATALISNHTLPSYHPALTLPDFLDTFGPLIFPLYRAAILRKRIVFLGDAPVEMSCNFIYNISLLSSLPHNLLSFLPSAKDIPSLRPRPLFNVGIHDMAYLSTLSNSADPCWIACSSDRVLGLRPELYDVLITLPPNYSRQAPEKAYPKMSLSPRTAAGQQRDPKAKSTPIKATQRDSRRFVTLRDGLKEFARLGEISVPDREDSDNTSTFSSNSLVEPVSWPLLAYTSFIWWASAGEKGAGLSDEEAEQDAALLQVAHDDSEAVDDPSNTPYRRESMAVPDANNMSQEIAIITYFRRLTTQIFTILFDIVSRADEELNDSPEFSQSESSFTRRYRDNEGEEEVEGDEEELNSSTLVGEHDDDQPLLRTPDDDDIITITSSDITNMGLDAWSHADKMFIVELVNVWWGRKAQVEGSHIQCCGVRII
ncbi:uncharacterized protein GIQ15_03991 [Arthroderma uncinatum]|uniref:uncharacterized protein n=1 Tax=Arthroderma uncinatum TaxID=74035 RepID=UPI00144AA05B|nr:uncharacterized protein GIQ15_03991 [Arthroderma uncinatum]KAF3481232.1 hypothetical protein GIQ15_03991 [Arthroderma uncinatum]